MISITSKKIVEMTMMKFQKKFCTSRVVVEMTMMTDMTMIKENSVDRNLKL